MRFVLILLAVLLVVWLLSGGRKRVMPPGAGKGDGSDQGAPKPMLACAQCGVHLPRDEALPGRGGVFCSEAHRQAYERAHPGS